MAVNNPDFKVKHGLRVGGNSTLAGGLSCLEDAQFSKNITVNGDLIVEGDTTTLNTTAIEVEDPLLSLGANNTTNTLDIGFYGQYSTDGGSTNKYAGFFRDADDGIFKLFSEQTADPSTGNIDTTGVIQKATLSADLQGNATTATGWSSAITLAFDADSAIAGSVTFDGVGNSATFDADIETGGIDTIMIGDDQVTQAKIADDAVGADQLASNSVVGASITTGAIESNHFAGGAVNEAAMGPNSVNQAAILDNAVHLINMNDNSVGTDEIIDGSISTSKLSADSVATSHIIGGNVTETKLADDAVSSRTIGDDQVLNAAIATDAVNADSIAANAVGSSELADDAVDTNAIQDSAVTDGKIAANTITAGSIAADAVGSSELADDAVDTAAIANAAVTNAKIANSYITINGDSVDLGQNITVEGLSAVIDSPTVDLHITGQAGNAVLSADIITADTTLEAVSTGGLSGLRVKALGIEASHMADNSVITRTILDGNVTTAKLDSGAVTDAKIGLDHAQFVTLSGDAISTETVFDSTAIADYRAVNYFVQVQNSAGSGHQSSYITLLHNGADVWIMEHGMIHTTADTFVTWDADIDSGNMRLKVTLPGDTDDTGTVRAIKSGIKINS